jgi:hypothetical protein
MAWKFTAAFLLAITLIYLGSLSVWVTVLSLGVKVLLAVLATLVVGAAGMYVWQRYRKERSPRLIFKGK